MPRTLFCLGGEILAGKAVEIGLIIAGISSRRNFSNLELMERLELKVLAVGRFSFTPRMGQNSF